MAFRKILWPTDESEPALLALRQAVELAGIFDAELFALRVIAQVPVLPQTSFAYPEPATFNVPQYEEELRKVVEQNVQKTIAENVPEDMMIRSSVLFGETHRTIIDFVREKKIELIVMATHGRTGFAHLFLGSVAEKVLRHSPVPVLTVPAAAMEKSAE